MLISNSVLLRDSFNFMRNQLSKIVLLSLWAAVLTLCALWLFDALVPSNTLLSAQQQSKIVTRQLLINCITAPLFSVALLTLLQSSAKSNLITAWQALQGVPKHYIKFLLVKIISIPCIMFGLLALVIPGIWLALRWSLASCILVNEPSYSWEILTRSWRLTAPHWVTLLAGHLVMIGCSLPLWGLLWWLNEHLISNPWLQALGAHTLNHLTQALVLIYCFRLYMQILPTPATE